MIAHAAGFFVTLSTRGGQFDGTVSVAVDDSEMAVLDELMRYVREPRSSVPTQHVAMATPNCIVYTQVNIVCKQSLPRLAGWDQALM